MVSVFELLRQAAHAVPPISIAAELTILVLMLLCQTIKVHMPLLVLTLSLFLPLHRTAEARLLEG